MPIHRSSSDKVDTPPAAPEPLRPYRFHGLDLQCREGENQAVADCPFCTKRKFYVSLDRGLWDCKVCGLSGNSMTFLRQLWEESSKSTGDEEYKLLAKNRKLLDWHTLEQWGAVQSIVTGEWLLPGYALDGKLVQLYAYLRDLNNPKKRNLLPTPGLIATEASATRHGMFGMPLYDKAKPAVMLAEGPWDGMALYETMQHSAKVRKTTNVLAVPGCNIFFSTWAPFFAGKQVSLLFDNDHPTIVKTPNGSTRTAAPAGRAGIKRIAGLLATVDKKPKSVDYLHWGEEGYTEDLPSGYDVRDLLASGDTQEERIVLFDQLLEMIVPVPKEWKTNRKLDADGKPIKLDLQPLPCSDWRELTTTWRKALQWRQELEGTLAVMLAVALSTESVGDQLFLQVIGAAGSGKTRLCEGLLVSKTCHPLEHLTGFHSGWKDKSGKDHSLLSRINHKTLITPEGDVLMSSPHFNEIMSQQRRIFDGSSGASYKNRKEDVQYKGLRTPWIIAGTPALLDKDQSKLGDRFLRIFLHPPSEEDKNTILHRVAYGAMDAVCQTSNGDGETTVAAELAIAYRTTGGYVDWLRKSREELLKGITYDRAWVAALCTDLANFVADMRPQPESDWHRRQAREGSISLRRASKELPTRLTHQFVRLAVCLAVVMGRKTVDEEVMQLVRKVALDTASGETLDVAKLLYIEGDKGISATGLSIIRGSTYSKERAMLRFLKQLDVVECCRREYANGKLSATQVRWKLTTKFRGLYERVHG